MINNSVQLMQTVQKIINFGSDDAVTNFGNPLLKLVTSLHILVIATYKLTFCLFAYCSNVTSRILLYKQTKNHNILTRSS